MSQLCWAGNKIYDTQFEFHILSSIIYKNILSSIIYKNILSSIIYKNIQEGELNAPIMRAWKTRFTAKPPASKNRKSQR